MWGLISWFSHFDQNHIVIYVVNSCFLRNIRMQFAGINGVLYYTPQILEDAGVSVLLADLGLSTNSASFLISAFTNLLMLPCIGIAMKLMDISGRR